MIKVAPMPDEPALAHEARRRHVVGARHQQEHFAWMRAELGAMSANADSATDLEILARASGMSTQSYAVEHTLVSTFIVAAPADECQPFGSLGIARRTRQFGMRLPRKRALVCHECIDDDLANKQFSWFRRSHQLVGVEKCVRHNEFLYPICAEQPFECTPNLWRDEGLVSERPFGPMSSTANAFIDRHVSISMSILLRDRPVPCEGLNQRLCEQARRLHVGSAKTKGQALLSDRVLELARDDWLYRHFPHFAMKAPGMVYREIDNILKRRETAAPGETYALALAALFESAEAALHTVALADGCASVRGKVRGEI